MVAVDFFIILIFFVGSFMALLFIGGATTIKALRKNWVRSKTQFEKSLEARNHMMRLLMFSFLVIIFYELLVIQYVTQFSGKLFFTAYGGAILFVAWSVYYFNRKYCVWYLQSSQRDKESGKSNID
ncbi:MAG: hypothetical protein GXO25_05145 [Euryarchaeota archaeon]|nr:hypothetical protein [Euryarchaeota archaeon]